MVQSAKTVYKCTILFTTNQQIEAQTLADRIIVMIRGGFYNIGTEQQLLKRNCKGIQLYLKMKPELCQKLEYLTQVRKTVAETFSGIKALQSTKYFMMYYLPSNAQARKQPTQWSTVFHRMEQLRGKLDLETYTITFSCLEQIFYGYDDKFSKLNAYIQ